MSTIRTLKSCCTKRNSSWPMFGASWPHPCWQQVCLSSSNLSIDYCAVLFLVECIQARHRARRWFADLRNFPAKRSQACFDGACEICNAILFFRFCPWSKGWEIRGAQTQEIWAKLWAGRTLHLKFDPWVLRHHFQLHPASAFPQWPAVRLNHGSGPGLGFCLGFCLGLCQWGHWRRHWKRNTGSRSGRTPICWQTSKEGKVAKWGWGGSIATAWTCQCHCQPAKQLRLQETKVLTTEKHLGRNKELRRKRIIPGTISAPWC